MRRWRIEFALIAALIALCWAITLWPLVR